MLKVGAKVKIRSDLAPDKEYGGAIFPESHLQYLGKEATIVEKHGFSCKQVDKE